MVSARAARTVPEVKGETPRDDLPGDGGGRAGEVTGTMAAPGFPSRTGRSPGADRQQGERHARGDGAAICSAPSRATESYDHDAGYQASFDGVIAHFVDCLETGAPFETDPADNLETLRLVEHAYWAAGIHGPTRPAIGEARMSRRPIP